jgi:hypothetical protein
MKISYLVIDGSRMKKKQENIRTTRDAEERKRKEEF